MAQITEVQLVDDLDGSKAAETVSFGLDGDRFEIDLSTKNAKQLRKELAEYVAAARSGQTVSPLAAPARQTRRRGQSGEGVSPAELRAWALSAGIAISDRGRVSADIRQRYAAAR